ncbi:hypothetical protein [Actinocorallia longicatena]|uniref:hypothetical protein n=1 Tax=Actinocorallia longicatena TaxID=111803 RepID=UPI0031CF0C7A
MTLFLGCLVFGAVLGWGAASGPRRWSRPAPPLLGVLLAGAVAGPGAAAVAVAGAVLGWAGQRILLTNVLPGRFDR